MKKRRISFGWLLTAGLLSTVFVCSCANTTTKQNDGISNNQDNASYVTVNFLSEDPDVTFDGETTIKTRQGKIFGQINPPIAKKPNASFDHWFYIDAKTSDPITMQPDTLLVDGLQIYPYFIETPPVPPVSFFTVSFNIDTSKHSMLEHVSGSLISPIYQIGTIWDAIEKPIIRTQFPENFFVGWSLTNDEENQLIPYDYVPTHSITVYPVIADRFFRHPKMGDVAIDGSLNFTATSDNAKITLRQHGEGKPPQVQYYWNYDVSTVYNKEKEDFNRLLPDEQISIPKGHTINLVGGDIGQMEPLPFSMSEYDYSSFEITGDIWVSGTLAGLLNCGNTSPRQLFDPTTLQRNGSYEFYKLFENATNNNPNSHLHISQDIRFRDDEYSLDDLNNDKFICQSFIPFPQYGPHMFEGMFANSGLELIPNGLFKRTYSNEVVTDGGFGLPIDYRLSSYCYKEMFLNCDKIWFIEDDFVPSKYEIKGETDTIPEGSLQAMFKGCSNLQYITPNLFMKGSEFDVTNIGPDSLIEMFSGCSKMTILLGPDYELEGPFFLDLENIRPEGKTDIENAAYQMFNGWHLEGFDEKHQDGTPTDYKRYYITFTS